MSKRIDLAAGYQVNASTTSIAFLWSNWEYLYALIPGPISARRISDDAWEGRGFLGRGEWHITKREVGETQGRFEYFTYGSFLGITVKAKQAMEYYKIAENLVSYKGTTVVELPMILRPIAPLFIYFANAAVLYINKIGAAGAEMISSKPEIVKERFGEDAWLAYLTILKEQKNISNANTSQLMAIETPFIHNGNTNSSHIKGKEDDTALLIKKIEELQLRIDHLGKAVNCNEYYTSIAVFKSDPKMALVKNRTIIERIAKHIFENSLREKSGTRMLGELLDRLAKDTKDVPANIIALMRTVSVLGNVGGHVESSEIDIDISDVDFCEFTVSFTSTLKVTEWFLVQYLGK